MVARSNTLFCCVGVAPTKLIYLLSFEHINVYSIIVSDGQSLIISPGSQSARRLLASPSSCCVSNNLLLLLFGSLLRAYKRYTKNRRGYVYTPYTSYYTHPFPHQKTYFNIMSESTKLELPSQCAHM
jgi:hypothetical protein